MRPPSKHELLENEVKHLQELALENLIGACEMDGYGHFIGCIAHKRTGHLLLQWLDVRGVSYDNKKLHGHLEETRANMALEDPTKCKQFYWDLAEQEYCLMTGHPSNNVNGTHVPKPRKETYDYLWAP